MKRKYQIGAIAIVILLTISTTFTILGTEGVDETSSDFSHILKENTRSNNLLINGNFVIVGSGSPSAPTLTSAKPGNAQIELSWSAPSSSGGAAITGYKIYRGTTSGGETLIATLGNVLTGTNTGLSNGQTYYYKVTAINSVGEGPQSNEASGTPSSSATVPSAPTLTSAKPGNAQIELSWSAPSSSGGAAITAYKVYRGTTSGGQTLIATLGNVLTGTNTGLINGQTYYYKVSAVNSYGEGPRSNEAYATPSSSATVPSVPQSLSATAGNAQVVLSWAAPSSNGGAAITAYKVYRGTASGGETYLATLGNVLTYTSAGLTNGQTYYYKVTAINSVGEGPRSNEASAKPSSSSTVPSVPQSLSATAGNAQVVLSWAAPSSNGGAAITAYKVYRGTTSGAQTLIATLGNVLTYTSAGLTNGQTYYYKVTAINSVGEGPRSNEASGTPVVQSISPTGAKVLVYVSGSTYYAKNMATGTVLTSGTDAKTVIQTAFTKLTAGRTTMEKVLLQGNFNLKSTIVVPSYTILQLDGTVTAAASMENMVFSNGNHHIELTGGIWNHNGLAGNNPNTFMFYNCQYINIHDCDVRTGSISVKLTNHATISHNMVRNSAGSAIAVLLTCSDIRVTGNTCTDNGAGIYLYCERGDGRADIIENCLVDHNTVTRTQTDGISLYTEGTEDILRNCVVDSNVLIDCGIDGYHPGIAVGVGGGVNPNLVGSVDYNTITYNTVSETGAYHCGGGVNVRGDHNTIRGNTIKNTYDPGLALFNGNYNILDGNTVDGVRYRDGIVICDSSNNIVSNNRISNTAGAGIWITGAQFSGYYSNNNDIKGNTISGTSSYRVLISESGNTGNIIQNNIFVGGGSILNKGTGTIIRNNINS